MNTMTIPPVADLQPVDWAAIDCALYDWLNDLLELEDRIVWENLDEVQPDYPYLSLLRDPAVNVGGIPEQRYRNLDANGNPTEVSANVDELEELAYEVLNFTLTISCHVGKDAGRNDPTCNAMALLGKAKASLGLQSTIDRLCAAGISIVRSEGVVDSSLVVNSNFISRATLDVIFQTASVITDRVDYFDKAQLVSGGFGVDTIVDAS